MKFRYDIKNILGTTLPLVFVFSFALYSFGYANPAGNPPGNNIAAPINSSNVAQTKSGNIWADNIIADQLKALSQLCIGGNCRTSWPSNSGQFTTTCTVNSLIAVHPSVSSGKPIGTPQTESGAVAGNRLGEHCLNRITEQQVEEGWMFVSFDNCPRVSSRDCQGHSYCHFIQLQCEDGITSEAGAFGIN